MTRKRTLQPISKSAKNYADMLLTRDRLERGVCIDCGKKSRVAGYISCFDCIRSKTDAEVIGDQ